MTVTVTTAASEALRLRYGGELPDLPSDAPWNDTLAQLLSHRSVRAYRDEPLPPGTLELLVAAAQSASTSSNLQVFSVVAVEEPEHKARLAKLARNQEHVRRAPLFLAWVADLSRIEGIAERAGQVAEGLEYFEAFLMATVDAALAAQNAVVALESIGLSCCYIGALRNRPLEVAEELGLPPGTVALFGLCVGYEDGATPASVKPRLPQPLVLHRERYDESRVAGGVEAYDTAMGRFYAEQGLPQSDWSRHVVARLEKPGSLHGREHLVEILKRRGFRLR
ncbi:MAG: NADPH-dependent oxidoreductase [Steroidobacteraceae bacterium]